MKERPIIFNGEMVKAILDGRKTMTRRVVKNAPDVIVGDFLDNNKWYGASETDFAGDPSRQIHCPYGIPGDRLWVRESWVECFMACLTTPSLSRNSIMYRADGKENYNFGGGKVKWKPSIYMEKSMSRITLEIVGVRVERLQEITASDIISEGLDVYPIPVNFEKFRKLWDSLNGKKYPWASNPWVWVIEFRRL